jgi:hypothetical protein
LLEAEIDNWLDRDLNKRFNRVRSDLQLRLRTIDRGVYARHADAIEALQVEFAEIADRFSDFASEFDDWQERAGETWQAIAEEIEEQCPDLSDVELPQSEAQGETERFVLFDSTRDYFTQMDAYLAWRDGDELCEDA